MVNDPQATVTEIKKTDTERTDVGVVFVCLSVCLSVSVSVSSHSVDVCVQHSDGRCEHTLRLPDSFLACCALSDLRFSFVTMSLAQVKTTVRVSPIMAELA